MAVSTGRTGLASALISQVVVSASQASLRYNVVLVAEFSHRTCNQVC